MEDIYFIKKGEVNTRNETMNSRTPVCFEFHLHTDLIGLFGQKTCRSFAQLLIVSKVHSKKH